MYPELHLHIGHNSKHTINKTMKEFHLFNQNPEGEGDPPTLTLRATGLVLVDHCTGTSQKTSLGAAAVGERPVKCIVGPTLLTLSSGGPKGA